MVFKQEAGPPGLREEGLGAGPLGQREEGLGGILLSAPWKLLGFIFRSPCLSLGSGFRMWEKVWVCLYCSKDVSQGV